MKLGVFTASSGFWAQDIKVNTSKFMFEVRFKTETQANLGETPVKQATHMADVLFNKVLNGNIQLTRFTNGESGTKEVIPNVPFADVVEISANMQGIVSVKQADFSDPIDNDYIARFTIDVCNNGAIAANDKSYLRLELNGWKAVLAANNFGIATDPEITIYSAGSVQKVNQHIRYSRISAQAGETMSFGANGIHAIAVPYDTERVTLNSILGEFQEVKYAELELIANDLEDYILDFGGISLPYFKYRVLPIAMVESGTIQVVADSHFYLLQNMNYEAVEPASPGKPVFPLDSVPGANNVTV